MENHNLGLVDLMENGPVGAFIKEVFKSAEKHSSSGDTDTAKNILDVCEDVLLAYKRALMMTELSEEHDSLTSQAENIVNDNLLTKEQKTTLDEELNSAKAIRARKIIEGILKDD
jgi:hypothetical protein